MTLPARTRLRNLEVAVLRLVRKVKRLERQRAREKEQLGDHIGFQYHPRDDDDEWDDEMPEVKHGQD